MKTVCWVRALLYSFAAAELADHFTETFLPFDLELTYAAAIHLTMASTLFPTATMDRSYSQAAHSIFDEMILCGNRVAEARKSELGRIEGLFRELSKRSEQEGLQTLTLSDRETSALPGSNDHGPEYPTDASLLESGSVQAEDNLPVDPSSSENIDSLDLVGISSAEFLSIVDQINNPGFVQGALDAGPEWFVGNDMTGGFS